ncbi:MAG: response regulator, partial [Usitatibacteraceae bacterium]
MKHNEPDVADPPLAAVARGVLVIDDDSIQREWLSRILLRSDEFEIFTAASGIEALEVMRENAARIGLIVCDLQMPGLDGMALLRRIGELGYNPAVIISSSSDAAILRSVELMVKAVGLTVLGSLPKPVKPALLERLLQFYRQVPAAMPGADFVALTSADVERAFSAGEFLPHYQPKVNLINGGLAGVEALARWDHPVHGLLRPASFLPMIESEGKMPMLTQTIAAT